MSLTGSCLCGEVAYASSSPATLTALCHCSDCQKATGSTYTANAVVPEASFKVTKGEPKFYDTIGDSGKKNRHFFCANCGSPLFNKLDVMPGEVIIKSGGLDNGAADLKNVGVEFFCEQRLSFVPPAEGAKQLPRFG
ncbi:Mss4-like protein [Trichoderma sp. SZMC 28013]